MSKDEICDEQRNKYTVSNGPFEVSTNGLNLQ